MTYQKTVSTRQPLGKPGTLYDTSPVRATAYSLTGAGKLGYACTVSATDGRKVQLGGDGVFAGIIIAPLSYARDGLDASLDIAANSAVEVADKGRIVVMPRGPVQPGFNVCFEIATGAIAPFTGDTAPDGYTAIPGATFKFFDAAAGTPAVIEM